MAELDTSNASWPYDLAQLFLQAATCCDFKCDRMYVADGTQVEMPPPGCDCQLAALVDVVWQPVARGSMASCVPRKQATVTLVLDQCIVLPGDDEAPDALEVNDSARVTLAARWQILTGLQQARNASNLGGDCRSITPAGWDAVSQTGGIARWSTSWMFVTE